jgi:hypothetical protein
VSKTTKTALKTMYVSFVLFVISSITVLKGNTEHIDQPKRYLFSVYKEENTKYKWFEKTKGQIQKLANLSAKILNYFKH